MNFTQDWFTHNIPNFEKCMEALDGKRRKFLEIGAYEGRSTCWLIKNLEDTGTMVSIDPYIGLPEVEAKFHENVREACMGTKVIPSFIKATSYQGLMQLASLKWDFDFIYIDGNHDPEIALTDACMAWNLLRSGGVMLFDDYEYPHKPTKRGVDGFLLGFEGHYDIILKNYQLAVKKK